MGSSKIQDEGEVKRWIEEGKTYAWMVEEYERKYHLQVGQSMFGNFRARRGLERRTVRDDDLIPWEVKREHRYAWPINMLRMEARRRAGHELTGEQAKQVDGWLRGLERDGCVLHYDPDTEQGWWYVPRREGVDKDLIREPARKTTKMLNRDGL